MPSKADTHLKALEAAQKLCVASGATYEDALAERERLIVQALRDGHSRASLAALLGLSRQRLSQIR